jgi:hypothetical protein
MIAHTHVGAFNVRVRSGRTRGLVEPGGANWARPLIAFNANETVFTNALIISANAIARAYLRSRGIHRVLATKILQYVPAIRTDPCPAESIRGHGLVNSEVLFFPMEALACARAAIALALIRALAQRRISNSARPHKSLRCAVET